MLLAVGWGCAGFDPTPPPAAQVSFELDFPAGTVARVRLHDENEQLLLEESVTAGAVNELTLPPNRDVVGLRLTAEAGQRVLKAIWPSLARSDKADLGKVDSKQTAHAQLVQERIAGQGGAFSSMPESVFCGLAAQLATGSDEIAAFEDIVVELAQAGTFEGATPTFHALDARLDEVFVKESGTPSDLVMRYKAALAAAVETLEVPIVCDASLIKVMFTVDVSGNALDGNGVTQLVRQAPKSGKVYLAITVEETSPLADTAGLLKTQMTPNDADGEMFDDGTNGDEVASDGVFTRVLVLPRGMRVKYKYTNGSAGEGWTRTEEWPGNARLLEVRDTLSLSGQPDCLIIRRDVFGDEASNKNHVNLHKDIKASGGNLSFESDLGGGPVTLGKDGFYAGGLRLGDARERAPLTPAGIPEARENGICNRCPAPLTASTDDAEPPALMAAQFLSTSVVKVEFSEAMEFGSASQIANYAIVDDAGDVLPVLTAAASGRQVTLMVGAPDLRKTYTLEVTNLLDASANGNPLPAGSQVTIKPDYTPPVVVGVRSAPLRDLNPGTGDDPTIGQVVVVTFGEVLDAVSAENSANYRIVSSLGLPLEVRAAIVRDQREVWLVTEPQKKRRPYELKLSGVRDLSGNPVSHGGTHAFSGFALFKMTFGAVPGFAFLDPRGNERGLPAGSGLYLTGTVLAVARDLDGNSMAIGGRTDVTGVPAFEMKPSEQTHQGKPVYTLTVLAPPGTYAWKVAHGVPGEWKNPPTTLVKVHKSLCSTNDATGVDISPITLVALGIPGADGTPQSGISYSAATLSLEGLDKPGPFGNAGPPTIMFKRENPDEVCVSRSTDINCPAIVVGTWRDIEAFKTAAGTTTDYDDGVRDVDPACLTPDLKVPRLVDINVFSSYSLILTFDERLGADSSDFVFFANDAASGEPLGLSVDRVGTLGDSELLPHQIWLKVDEMPLSRTYTLSYNTIADVSENVQSRQLTQSFTSPSTLVPDEDTRPPSVVGAQPRSPTSLLVKFDEEVERASATNVANYVIAGEGTAPQVTAAELQPGSTEVLLTTTAQTIEADYTLTVGNVLDAATPPNTLTEQVVPFKGFGDTSTPKVIFAQALSPTSVALGFDEPLWPETAAAAGSYAIRGVSVTTADFGAAPIRRAAAFNSTSTTFSQDVVVLTTSAMSAGERYTITPSGVTDLSGNACENSIEVVAVAKAPKVDVLISYLVSDTEKVGGRIPSRAINAATLAAKREGLFILGATVSVDGTQKSDISEPVTAQLGGFPPAGQPLDGIEPQLSDDGQHGDLAAGDHVFSILIRDVPLGTSLQWKTFASHRVGSDDPLAIVADPQLGPSIYSDGQEYPGNENAVRILGDPDGDGLVQVRCLFGDEITYKKFTDAPPFVWVTDDVSWKKQ
ncbi:MAG: hypothetical protein JRH20_00660 [Deltaproteobacteria bacterium]|nr:hypothetical protein [Deltaproteobacteria bacterium]